MNDSLVGQLTTNRSRLADMTFDSGVPELGRRAWVLVLMVMMMLKVVMMMLEMVMMMFDTGDDFVLKAGRSSWTLAGGRSKRHIG